MCCRSKYSNWMFWVCEKVRCHYLREITTAWLIVSPPPPPPSNPSPPRLPPNPTPPKTNPATKKKKKKSVRVGMYSDSHELIPFKLAMMVDTTEPYVLMQIWLALTLKRATEVWENGNLCASYHTNSSNDFDGQICCWDLCSEKLVLLLSCSILF